MLMVVHGEISSDCFRLNHSMGMITIFFFLDLEVLATTRFGEASLSFCSSHDQEVFPYAGYTGTELVAPSHTIIKKVIMALTGLVWLGFVFFHMYGNLKIFLGRGLLQRVCRGPARFGGAGLCPSPSAHPAAHRCRCLR